MNLRIICEVDDEDDEDPTNKYVGITNEAYERLIKALSEAGFSVVDISA